MTRKHILQLMQKLDVSVVSERPNSGGYVPMRCPLAPWLHEKGVDGNPSFFVKVNDQGMSHWHCFTCKAKGSRMSSLVRKLEYYREESYQGLAIKADLAETPTEFARFEDDYIQDDRPVPLDPNIYDGLYPPVWDEGIAKRYLQERRIGKQTAEALGLLFDPEERRILFPVRDRDGNLFGFSGRSVLPPDQYTLKHPRIRDYEFSKDKFLLGEHLWQQGKPLWVVEGLFALARMVEVGAREKVNPVAPMMSALSYHQRQRVVDLADIAYLCFDPDKAGDQGMFGVLKQDGTFKGGGAIDQLKTDVTVLVPPYPEGVADIDDITPEDFDWMFANAELA